jgi:hypothetical protein
MSCAARPGFPALVIGFVTLADALAARWLLRADEERVFVLGRPIEWVCALRSRFGLPCPTCGLTRSVVMSLHGEFARAWRMAPVGPVAVIGLVAFAIAMLALAWLQWAQERAPQGVDAVKWEARARVYIRKGAAIYAMGVLMVWLGGWAVSFRAAMLWGGHVAGAVKAASFDHILPPEGRAPGAARDRAGHGPTPR